MAASSHRHSAAAQPNVNLYCAQCESQIGIFENEWIRLTSSYGRSKEKGIHFATEIGNRTQVVPSGPAQRSAEGCVMAEVFCRKCSNMVGQYCKSAPDVEKQALVDQYFYKFSRTYLKDSRTMAKIDPVFGYGSDIVQPVGSQSSEPPRNGMTPTSRWANTPMRQSSRTPVTLSQGTIRPSMRWNSQESSILQPELRDHRWKQQPTEIQRLQDEVSLQRLALEEQSERIETQVARLDEQEARLQDQESSFEDQEGCLSAQAARIVEQDAVIKMQTRRLENQQFQLTTITNQLSRLQKTMDDLRTTLVKSQANPLAQTQGAQDERVHVSNDSTGAVRNARSHANELATFHTQNQIMRSRLAAFANTVGGAADASSDRGFPEDMSRVASPSTALSAVPALGKRKRDEAVRPVSRELGSSARVQSDSVAPRLGSSRQMPTPQASDGGQHSPAQSPPITTNNTMSSQKISNRTRRRAREQPETSEKASEAQEIVSKNNRNSPIDDTRRSVEFAHDQVEHAVPTGFVDNELVPGDRTSGSSLVKRRRRGRPSKSLEATEATSSEDEASMLDVPNSSNRRVTRARAKATKPSNMDVHEQHQVTEREAPPSKSSVSCIQTDEELQLPATDFAPPSPSVLPSVQTASNVLGVNLGALIASSQALMQDTDSEPIPSYSTLIDDQGDIISAYLSPSNQVQANDILCLPDLPLNSMDLDSSTIALANDSLGEDVSTNANEQVNNDGQVEFVPDSGIHDLVEAGDDGYDNDLFRPDTSLYGGGCDVAEDINLAEWTGSAILHTNDNDHACGIANRAIATGDRSMALESDKLGKSTTGPVKGYTTLDAAHMAIPKSPAEADAVRCAPKASKPRRGRELHDELTLLGLSHWIDRDKNCKEYRQEVSAARERVRNDNKASYLKSIGLSNDLSVTSSTKFPSRPESIVPKSSSLVVETASAPVATVIENVQPDNAPADETVKSQEQPRVTRARTRRSSVPLMPGLEAVETRATEPEPKQEAPRTRRSGGRTRSQRKSEIIADAGDTNHADQADTGCDERPVDQDADNVIPTVSLPAAALATARPATEGNAVVNDEPGLSQRLGSKSRAQRREEAILLRDRMAKELMEREDMDM